MGDTPLKCRLVGHEWVYYPEEKVCARCRTRAANEREQEHDDPTASIGETRVHVEERDTAFRLVIEEYRRTASGPENEYYQWFPVSTSRIDEGNLEVLRDEIEEVLGPND